MSYAVKKDGTGFRAVLSENDIDAVTEVFSQTPPTLQYGEATVRSARDRLIAASDWTQLPDAPLTTTQKAAWKTYRQALRDVTAQAGFPDNVTWPKVP
jgi:hypothetical protein